MKNYFRRFPWIIFFRVFLAQFLIYNALFIAVLLVSQVFNLGQSAFLEVCGVYAGCTLVFSLFLSYRLCRPLQKIILKATRISSKKTSQEVGFQNEDFLVEELGEYSELESVLNRIARKLKKKKEQLVREREENQAFMSSVQEGLVSVSLEEKLLYFNSQFAAQFISPQDLQNPGTPISLKDLFRVPEVNGGFQAALKQGRTAKLSTKLNTRLDNLPRFFAVSITPLRKAKTREIYGAIGIFHDITELKKAEQIRIEFVGNASHELRTPLTSIKGYVETLKGDVRAGRMEQADKFLEIISRNVDRLIDLVNDLLSISALDSNSELQIEQVNPLLISEHVMHDMLVIASGKNQGIRVIGEVPPFMADSRKVEQVLRNLVSNAIKYIPSGGHIQIRWESDANNAIVLRVIDDGPGVPQEHHQRLFERFYRVDKGRTRDLGGTGLGLAIVKHIMQSHGGSVQISNSSGPGAEFICIFPRITRA
jgi:two-component system phosphate regulon sensor histidine kinase PhoR